MATTAISLLTAAAAAGAGAAAAACPKKSIPRGLSFPNSQECLQVRFERFVMVDISF